MRVVKPMLAATYGDDKKHTKDITFPAYVSPKIDGFRALVVDGKVQSRSGKLIPCPTIQRLFGRPELEGMDGELALGPTTAPDLMQRCGRFMSKDELTEEEIAQVSFNVFDMWEAYDGCPYWARLHAAMTRLETLRITKGVVLPGVALVPHKLVNDEAEMLAAEDVCLAMGYEGLMVNSYHGVYKSGRAGKKKPELLKIKRFVDDEAEIIGFVEMMHNENEAFKSELGRTKRSTKKEGMVAAGVLGAFKLRVLTGVFKGVEFECSGFTQEQRELYFQMQDELLGKIGTFKHFMRVGAKDKPRQPGWKCLRDAIDMSPPGEEDEE